MSNVKRVAALFVFSLAASGCAGILGLDSGTPIVDDAGSEPDDDADDEPADTSVSDASTVDASTITADTSTMACKPGTADCNDNPADGCETNLNDPMHCGSCTKKCAPMSACMSETCCLMPHAPCSSASECCSGNCGPGASGCH